MEEKIELEKLEDVDVTFGEHAFAPESMFCDKCDLEMKKTSKYMTVSEDVKVNLDTFKCPKCKEEMIGLDEARKLDRALVINRLLQKNLFTFKRRLSFDGDNYIFRLPSELAKGKHKEVEMLPLESNEALIRW